MARAILTCGLLLVAAGLTACSGSTYLIKPGTADPMHVVRCETQLSAKSALLSVVFLPLGFIVRWQDYQDCLDLRHNQGYVDAPEEPECAYWRDDKPDKEIKIRDSCKANPPEWALRRAEVTPHVAVAATTEVAAVPADFRTWLPGHWDGSGGGYELTISSNLKWEYASTVRGRWYASGTARIEGPATIVLEGWFSGIGSYGRAPTERLTMVLHRRGESLSGEFRLSGTWIVTFLRSSPPATK